MSAAAAASAAYLAQCTQWHSDCIQEFKTNSRENVLQRLNSIEHVANTQFAHYPHTQTFAVNADERERFVQLINQGISEQCKVDHQQCNGEITSVFEYRRKARNKLNRWKPKTYGKHVLGTVLFVNIYNHCHGIGATYQLNNYHILQLFVRIFLALIDETIQFKRTKSMPLILTKCFVENTAFRMSCIHFLEHFNLMSDWQHNSRVADNVCKSFRALLVQLTQSTAFTSVSALPPPILVKHMTVEEYDRGCRAHYARIVELVASYFARERRRVVIMNDDTILACILDFFCGDMQFWTVFQAYVNHDHTTSDDAAAHNQRHASVADDSSSFRHNAIAYGDSMLALAQWQSGVSSVTARTTIDESARLPVHTHTHTQMHSQQMQPMAVPVTATSSVQLRPAMIGVHNRNMLQQHRYLPPPPPLPVPSMQSRQYASIPAPFTHSHAYQRRPTSDDSDHMRYNSNQNMAPVPPSADDTNTTICYQMSLSPQSAAQQPSMSFFGDRRQPWMSPALPNSSPFPYLPMSPVNTAMFAGGDDSHTFMSLLAPPSAPPQISDNDNVHAQSEHLEPMLLDSCPNNSSEANHEHVSD